MCDWELHCSCVENADRSAPLADLVLGPRDLMRSAKFAELARLLPELQPAERCRGKTLFFFRSSGAALHSCG